MACRGAHHASKTTTEILLFFFAVVNQKMYYQFQLFYKHLENPESTHGLNIFHSVAYLSIIRSRHYIIFCYFSFIFQLHYFWNNSCFSSFDNYICSGKHFLMVYLPSCHVQKNQYYHNGTTGMTSSVYMLKDEKRAVFLDV